MDLVLKILGIGLFVAFVYFAVDSIIAWIMAIGLPELPNAVRYLGFNTGLFVALNIYIKIVIYGFIAKQILGYVRSV